MPLSTKVSGSWREALEVHVKVSGVWKPVQEVWTKVAGVWKLVMSALSATLNSPSYAGDIQQSTPGETVTAQFTAAVVASGVGVTYNWLVTGVYSVLLGQGTTAATVRLVDSTPQTQLGTIACQVTDSLGNIVTTEASDWSLTIQEPPV